MRKAIIGALLLVGSIVVGLAVGAAGQDQVDVSALQHSTTYNISAIEIQYPYRDPAVLDGDNPDSSRAGVTYTSDWVGSEYPAGIVQGARATGSVAIKDDLENAGATWAGEPAFHGNIVWGRVVADIPDFCRELVAAIEAR